MKSASMTNVILALHEFTIIVQLQMAGILLQSFNVCPLCRSLVGIHLLETRHCWIL